MTGVGPPERVDVFVTVRRRWRVVAAVPFAAMVLALAFVYLVRPQFDARASLRFLDDRSPFGGSLAPLIGEGGGGSLSLLASLAGQSVPVQTEMAVIQSRALARSLVDEMGLRLELRSPRRSGTTRLFSSVSIGPDVLEGDYTLRRAGDGAFDVSAKVIVERDPFRPIGSERRERIDLGTATAGEALPIDGARVVLAPSAAAEGKIRFRILAQADAVDRFQERLSVTQPRRDADVVNVDLRWEDPQLVWRTTNRLVERFIDEREALLTRDFGRTADFLGHQLDSLRAELVEAEEALRVYRESEQVVEPTAQATAAIEQLAEFEVRRDVIFAEREALLRLLDDVSAASEPGSGESSPLRRLVFFPTLFQSQATAELLGLLAELENDRGALLERRTTNAREITALDARIRDIESELRSVAETYLQGLRNQVDAFDDIIGGFRRELDRVPSVELEYVRRRRQVEVLSELYVFMEVQQKEAEVTAAGESLGVRIVDAAEVPIEAALPKPLLTLALSLVVGLGLGVGGAVALEHASGTGAAAGDEAV